MLCQIIRLKQQFIDVSLLKIVSWNQPKLLLDRFYKKFYVTNYFLSQMSI